MNSVFWLQLESIAGRETSESGPGYVTSVEALNTSASQPSQASQPAGTQVLILPQLLCYSILVSILDHQHS